MSGEDFVQCSIFLGLILIVLLSVADFRKKVRKSKSKWRHYVALAIFLAVNVTVYLALTCATLQQLPKTVLFGGLDVSNIYVQVALPLLVAVLYFGAGAGSFRLGNKEIQLYKSLLELLQNMFNIPLITTDDIGYEESRSQYEELRKKAESIQTSAAANQWDVLQSKWEEYAEDERLLNEQVRYLETLKNKLEAVRDRLGSDPATAEEVTEVVASVRKRIDTIRKTLVKKIQRYLVAFAFANLRDDKELEKFLLDIGVLRPDESRITAPSILVRSLVLGFVFGLLLGPIFGFVRDMDPILYGWIGAFCLMIFTGFASQAVATRNLAKSVILGAVGGYAAHLMWQIASTSEFGEFFQMLQTKDWDAKRTLLLKEPLIGMVLGIVTCLYLVVLKYHIPQRLTTSYKGYILAALGGLVLFPAVSAGFLFDRFGAIFVLPSACAGVVAMLALSVATNVVQPSLRPPPKHA